MAGSFDFDDPKSVAVHYTAWLVPQTTARVMPVSDDTGNHGSHGPPQRARA
jgi:hypothetical protein